MGTHLAKLLVAAGLLGAMSLSAQAPVNDLSRLMHSLRQFKLDNESWHLGASVQLFREGKPDATGNVDVLHDAGGKRREIYNFPQFHQTRYGMYAQGDGGDDPAAFWQVLQFLLLPADPEMRNAVFHAQDAMLQGQAVRCVTVDSTDNAGQPGAVFCTDSASSYVRYVLRNFQGPLGSSSTGVVFDGFREFQGHPVPTGATVFYGKVPLAKMSFDFSLAEDTALASLRSEDVAGKPGYTRLQLVGRVVGLPDDPALFQRMSAKDVASGGALIRVRIDGDGMVKDAWVMAASDADFAHLLARDMRGRQFTDAAPTPDGRFINMEYPFVRKSSAVRPKDIDLHTGIRRDTHLPLNSPLAP